MNEVEIVVVGKNDTKAAFASAEKDAKDSGQRAGKNFGDGFTRDSSGRLRDSTGKFAAEGAKIGTSIGVATMGNFTKQVTGSSPQVSAAIGIVAGAAAPVLGAALSAAVIGGAAAGGIIGGIMLVKDDPRITSAVQGVGQRVTDSLKVSATPFIQPVLNSLGILEGAFNKSAGNISNIFKKASTFVEPLATSAGRAFNSIIEGVDALVSSAGPVMQSIGNGIEGMGEAIADTFDSISDDAESAAAGLDLIFVAVNEGIATAGLGLKGLVGYLELLSKYTPGGWLARMGAFGDDVEGAADALASGNYKVAESADAVEDSTRSAADAIRDQADALKEAADPAFALMSAQEGYAAAQEKFTEATRKHGAGSREATSAANDLAQASVRLNSATAAAADTMSGPVLDSILATMRAAGAGQEEMDAFAASFRKTKSSGDQFAKTYKATVIVNGLEWNIAKLRQLNASIQNLPKYRQIQIVTQHLDVYNKVGGFSSRSSTAAEYGARRAGGPVGAASGGARGAMTLVGEDGPEIVNLPFGSSVKTAGATKAMLEGTGQGAPQQVQLTLNLQGADQDMQSMIQKWFKVGTMTVPSRAVTA